MADPTFGELGTQSFGSLSLTSSGSSGTGLASLSLEDLAQASFSDLATMGYEGSSSSGSSGTSGSSNPVFTPILTTSSALSGISVVNGQLIVATDTGTVYVDAGNIRIQVSDTSKLAANLGSNNSEKYLTVNSSGNIAPTDFPTAGTSTLGGVKTDGTIVTTSAQGVLSIDKNQLVKGTGTGSIALGGSSSASYANDIAIGTGAQASGYYVSVQPLMDLAGIAIGNQAQATNGAIQIGQGTNTTMGTVSFGFNNYGNFQILDQSHKVPRERLYAATTSDFGTIKPDGATITISDGVITAADQTCGVKKTRNAGKFLMIGEDGEIVPEALPIYNGEVS